MCAVCSVVAADSSASSKLRAQSIQTFNPSLELRLPLCVDQSIIATFISPIKHEIRKASMTELQTALKNKGLPSSTEYNAFDRNYAWVVL